MSERKTKLVSPAEAVSLVKEHDSIALTGWSKTRAPMALVYELIRQGKGSLTVATSIYGIDCDLLVGAGLVKRIEASSGGLSTTRGPWAYAIKYARERGEIEYVDFSALAMTLRFMAGAMGIPYIPTQTMLGSDLLTYLDEKYARESRCPFTDEPLVLLRALRPDVALIHAQQADHDGNVIIHGPKADDEFKAKAADTVIVSVDEIIDPELVMRQPHSVAIPSYYVDAVVHVPYGAHPTASYTKYNFDLRLIELWQEMSKSGEEGVRKFLEMYVFGVKDHFEYLEKVGGTRRMAEIAADALLGY